MTLPTISSMGAIVWGVGSHTYSVSRTDDGSRGPIPLGFSVFFSGKTYDQLYINNNGTVTFRQPLFAYTPLRLAKQMMPIIAPFFADLDTREFDWGDVSYSDGSLTFEGHTAFCVNWIKVGYYSGHVDKLNSFQVLLVNRSDTGDGNFDIVMNYGPLQWEAGDLSGGSQGLGGITACAGFAGEQGDVDALFEFTGSQAPGAFLDTSGTGLSQTSRDSSQLGRHVFKIRDGKIGHDASWVDTGRLDGFRVKLKPQAVRLVDGRVLATGGYNTNTDVYNPVSGTWGATGNAVSARRGHTMTLLKNGKVLVTGGEDEERTSSAELYSPSTGTWAAVASMNVGRCHHTATLLDDGRVLVAGGGAGTQFASAEIYNPSSNTWTLVDAMSRGRQHHTATPIPGGGVLVAGGQTVSGTFLEFAEVYDLNAHTWKPASNMTVARCYHTATPLPDGRVFVVGGGIEGSEDTAELYTSDGNSWTAAPSMRTPRAYHAATLLPTGDVLITGGYDSSTGSLKEAQLYEISANNWRDTAHLNEDHYHHVALLLDEGRVLVAGGISNSDQGSCELYIP